MTPAAANKLSPLETKLLHALQKETSRRELIEQTLWRVKLKLQRLDYHKRQRMKRRERNGG